jgi:hypothetical protein
MSGLLKKYTLLILEEECLGLNHQLEMVMIMIMRNQYCWSFALTNCIPLVGDLRVPVQGKSL